MSNDTQPNNPPAFPAQFIGPDFNPGQAGMTLRDWFAGMAMQGEIANGGFYMEGHMGKLAANAYAQADAMLAERAKECGK